VRNDVLAERWVVSKLSYRLRRSFCPERRGSIGTTVAAPSDEDAIRLRLWLPAVLGLFVAFAVFHDGLPALRHDWRVPFATDAEIPWLNSLFEGWVPNGIGSAQPYPTFYLVGFALWLMHFALDSYGLMAGVVLLSVWLAASSAAKVAANRGGPLGLQVAVAAFAALNPWVYSEYVAGHMLMVLAYAVLFALVAETGSARPRRWALSLYGALAILQIEFFAVAILPLLWWLTRRRQWAAMSVVLLSIAPIAYGITASFSQIGATPFNLVWQQSQSIAPWSAVVLNGYGFNYARTFANFNPVALLFVAAAVAGVPYAVRTTRGLFFFCATVSILIFAMGTKSAVGPGYDWLVLHVPEIGLFRELYDLLALVGIAYVVLLSEGFARKRPFGLVLAGAAVVWIVPWVVVSPATFFVNAATIPAAADPHDSLERVAYLPAFQPLTYEGHGSGVDPDAYVRTGRAAPLNEFFPEYPVNSALGYLERGDDRYVRSLGVFAVVERSYLRTDMGSLRHVLTELPRQLRLGGNRAARFFPLLSVVPGVPSAASLADDPADFAVFFGDRDPARVAGFMPSRLTNDSRIAWVDARLAVPARPELGSSFGGVTTTSAEPLKLPRRRNWNAVLAQTSGTLIDDTGRTVASAASRLRWWSLRPQVQRLACRGACAVVLVADMPMGLPEHVPLGTVQPAEVHFLRPWVGTAVLPNRAVGSLRLAVRYDRSWTAIEDGRILPHERLATTLNVWRLPLHGTSNRVYLIEVIAASQFLLELLAAGALLAVLARDAYPTARRLIAAILQRRYP